MKDVQRPWTLKAVVGTLRPGARLLEIGAGEPLVAELLARLGYDVTVIDPYDGRDRGPDDVETMKAAFPLLRFVQGLFPGDVPAGERYDGDLLDLGARARARRRDRRALRRDRPAASSPAVTRSTPSTTCSSDPATTITACGWHGSPRGSAIPAASSTTCSWSSAATPRPTSSPPRATTAGAAPCPTTSSRCGAASRSSSACRCSDGGAAMASTSGSSAYRSARLLGQCLRSLRDHPPRTAALGDRRRQRTRPTARPRRCARSPASS